MMARKDLVTARGNRTESFRMPPKKSAPKKKRAKAKDTRTQRERFEQFAIEHGATDDVLDKALGEVADAKAKRD